MSNSYRIRTQLGVDKSVRVHLSQEYEFLEILSLKVLQNEIYTRQCSDYGVVIGRISINGGFGLPNCKISIFIPLSAEDENNPIISSLYPYQSVSDLNDVGYRYNLLPSTKSYSAHVPTGSFFDKEDVLVNQSYIEVFDKYYRYTAVTNESGDFMIFGVPIGTQTIHVDVDLSDIGEFSLAPQDLIRTGLATEAQVSGTRFKSSANLNELPQIISINRVITVEPLWGQADLCNIGITRTDFDLSSEANVVIEPTAIFMGSIFSDADNLALKTSCRPKFAQGELCSLVAGPGEILAIRQTIFEDTQGRPVLEEFELESGGQVIDENGTWLVDLPMNLDYVTTNEFGERVFSDSPEIGIPTRGKYRFKVKWNQSPNLSENVRRAYFLVPNIREYGWTSSGLDPLKDSVPFSSFEAAKKSYAFSLDWGDYVDPQTAINCEDTFYQFSYNKVYTISQLIDQYRNGTLANRTISVKNILDTTCESENNKFPTNDASFRWDFIFLLFYFASYVFRPILIALVPVIHVLYVIVIALRVVLIPLLIGYLGLVAYAVGSEFVAALAGGFTIGLTVGLAIETVAIALAIAGLITLNVLLYKLKLKAINLPLLLYDQCEFCPCGDGDEVKEDEGQFGTNNSNTGQLFVPPPLPNASGVQITNLEGGIYNIELIADQPAIGSINSLISGTFVQYFPFDPLCYSKVPFKTTYNQYEITQDDANQCVGISGNVGEKLPTDFYTFSLTLAERINLFNTKAKYFDPSISNPGGGVNRVKVKIEPTLNPDPNKVHYDNVICMLMTPDSLATLTSGTLLTFVDPNKSSDINFTGATLNEYGTTSITGTSFFHTLYQQLNPGSSTYQIQVNYAKFDNTGNQTVYYQIPPPNTGDTNFHKFPTDVEYFQVITAMTYNQFVNQTQSQYPNTLRTRFLDNDMKFNYLINRSYAINVINYFNPLQSLLDYEQQTIVFLSRGVDPYSTRIETRYELGRLFGYINYDSVVVTSMAKLNIPIQGSFLNVNHSNIYYSLNPLYQHQIAQSQDTYSSSYLYYNTYDYVPSLVSNPFSAYSTDNLSYYSSVGNGVDSWPNCQPPHVTCGGSDGVNDNNYGYRVSNPINTFIPSPNSNNFFLMEFDNSISFIGGCSYYQSYNQPNSIDNRGYFVGEIVEGASYMTTVAATINNGNGQFALGGFYDGNIDDYNNWQVAKYIGTKYPTIGNTFTITLGSSNRQLIIRSDRLPTSDRLLQNCATFFSLQQNQNLGIYVIPDDGALNVPSNTGGISTPTQQSDNPLPPNFVGELLDSTNKCSDSRNLECYNFTPNGVLPSGQFPGGGRYNVNSGFPCQEFLGKTIFDKGCYKLVTTVLLSIPKDISLITEWLSRTNITFGACKNVFSHLFVNNWINGSLYAFAFKNIKITNINGEITPIYCRNVIYFDQDTNNFYYRSSPYTTIGTDGFVGKEAPTKTPSNQNNLLFPTTIMDLGPRTNFLQEIVFSDEYDGYVVDQLKSTSFQDVSEMLNLLIITRLANSNFIQLLIGTDGGSIFNYFTRVPLLSVNQRLNVDADYAQMISINSELGVVPFEAENYPNVDTTGLLPNQFAIDPVYFNSGNQEDTIFGIFYSSDTQIRDFITPKRTIINDLTQFTDRCAFNNFYCYSQEVPFYQWEIKNNRNPNPPQSSIFGSQRNDWWSRPVNGQRFFSHKYQSLDRGNILSRYFRTNTSIFTRDFRGFIYSIETQDPNKFYTFPSLNPLNDSWDRNSTPPSNLNLINVGAPFYFYFGLKRGKSAWDRFAKKWINTEPNTQ